MDNVKYETITVYSGGNKKSNNAKCNIFMAACCLILFCIIIVITYFMQGLLTIIMLPVVIPLIILMIFIIKFYKKAVQDNKLISFYMFDVNEFIKLKSIPGDKTIFLSDRDGAVLIDKQYEKETKDYCSFYQMGFKEFRSHCKKDAVSIEMKS